MFDIYNIKTYNLNQYIGDQYKAINGANYRSRRLIGLDTRTDDPGSLMVNSNKLLLSVLYYSSPIKGIRKLRSTITSGYFQNVDTDFSEFPSIYINPNYRSILINTSIYNTVFVPAINRRFYHWRDFMGVDITFERMSEYIKRFHPNRDLIDVDDTITVLEAYNSFYCAEVFLSKHIAAGSLLLNPKSFSITDFEHLDKVPFPNFPNLFVEPKKKLPDLMEIFCKDSKLKKFTMSR